MFYNGSGNCRVTIPTIACEFSILLTFCSFGDLWTWFRVCVWYILTTKNFCLHTMLNKAVNMCKCKAILLNDKWCLVIPVPMWYHITEHHQTLPTNILMCSIHHIITNAEIFYRSVFGWSFARITNLYSLHVKICCHIIWKFFAFFYSCMKETSIFVHYPLGVIAHFALRMW